MWEISDELYNKIREILPAGKTILEFGSGKGSKRLAEDYTVHSIEHDKDWVDKFKGVNYIHAPIVDGWYDLSKDDLPEEYDLLLIDGPPGVIGREGFFDNLKLFNTGVPMIFDDVNRQRERWLMTKVHNSLKDDRVIKIFSSADKQFGVIE